MTVTIQRRDWSRDVRYEYPCDCLLARAIKRTFHPREVDVISPGLVFIRRIGKRSGYWYHYNENEYEASLATAHYDPSLLPMTIRLR